MRLSFAITYTELPTAKTLAFLKAEFLHPLSVLFEVFDEERAVFDEAPESPYGAESDRGTSSRTPVRVEPARPQSICQHRKTQQTDQARKGTTECRRS